MNIDQYIAYIAARTTLHGDIYRAQNEVKRLEQVIAENYVAGLREHAFRSPNGQYDEISSKMIAAAFRAYDALPAARDLVDDLINDAIEEELEHAA